jgi:hypothetical protein
VLLFALNQRSNKVIIYQIKLPKKQDVEAFVKFMSDEYFPAIHKGATRIGQVTDLTLLERENEMEGDDVEHEFFWHVGWSGLRSGNARVDDKEVARKFESIKAKVKRIGSHREVAAWPKGAVANQTKKASSV